MDTISVPLKQCSRKTQCIHPESDNGFLPATSEYFHKNSRSRDSLFYTCKCCTLADHKTWREQNPTYFNEYDAKRMEKHKEARRIRWQENLNENRAAERQRYISRRDTQVKNARERRASEKGKQVVSTYHGRPEILDRYRIHASNRRAREKRLANTFTHQEWVTCLKFFGDKCAICGAIASESVFIAADHWIAITDKRRDNPGTVVTNIIPLCHGSNGCNNAKSNKDPVVWLIATYGETVGRALIERIEAYFRLVGGNDKPFTP